MAEVLSNADVLFPLLGNELWRFGTAKMLAAKAWKGGAHPLAGFFGNALTSCRHWLDGGVQGELLSALLAPWTLHTGLGPDSSMSALMAKLIAFTLEAVGMPMVRGGNGRTVDAFARLIREAGGTLLTGADVERVLVHRGRAAGVRLSDGREFSAQDVVCNVTPTQLYGRLLESAHVPPEIAIQAKAYRYGRGNMQIHLALSEPPQWPDASLDSVSYLHLSDGPAAVSKAVNEAERGLLPAEPTICVAQPSAVDASRAPAGQAVLWIQLPECPRIVRGDAAGLIPAPVDGKWTPEIRDAYAERVIDKIARHVPNLRQSIVGQHAISPTDLSRLNINLVGGDPYGGACDLDQSFLWRPLRGTRNHETPVKHLWHIGASTHPGPGLGGTSGFHVAQALSAN
jgi:phytoene dehydrogenase-like protein